MILGFLLNAVTSLLSYIISKLPAYNGLPEGLTESFNFFSVQTANACSFVSGVCTALNQILVIVFYIIIGIVIFDFFAWVFHWKQPK